MYNIYIIHKYIKKYIIHKCIKNVIYINYSICFIYINPDNTCIFPVIPMYIRISNIQVVVILLYSYEAMDMNISERISYK